MYRIVRNVVMLSIVLLCMTSAVSAANLGSKTVAGVSSLQAANNSVTNIKGTFTVPAITSNGANEVAVIIAGIDFRGSALIGTGVYTGTNANGVAVYYPVYQTANGIYVMQGMSVAPGDVVNVETAVNNGNVTFKMTNGNNTVTIIKNMAYRANAANWFIEATKNADGTYKNLANFGNVAITGTAVVNGNTRTIGTISPYDTVQMLMASSSVIRGEAAVSGETLTVTWNAP